MWTGEESVDTSTTRTSVVEALMNEDEEEEEGGGRRRRGRRKVKGKRSVGVWILRASTALYGVLLHCSRLPGLFRHWRQWLVMAWNPTIPHPTRHYGVD
jgi:hypothetical protein